MWYQRSRVLWLSKGDNNTAFFHNKATKRFRKNLIKGIKDQNGARAITKLEVLQRDLLMKSSSLAIVLKTSYKIRSTTLQSYKY